MSVLPCLCYRYVCAAVMSLLLLCLCCRHDCAAIISVLRFCLCCLYVCQCTYCTPKHPWKKGSLFSVPSIAYFPLAWGVLSLSVIQRAKTVSTLRKKQILVWLSQGQKRPWQTNVFVWSLKFPLIRPVGSPWRRGNEIQIKHPKRAKHNSLVRYALVHSHVVLVTLSDLFPT